MKQTFSYVLCGAVLALLLGGCSGINALLKSGKPELIYSKALEYYEIGKWQRASTLFEGVQHYYAGTSREDTISFYNARCKFKNRDYETPRPCSTTSAASSAAAPSSRMPRACTHSASTTFRRPRRATRR